MGRVVLGLDGFPATRPLLIVGNHQLGGQDTFELVDRLLQEKDVLIRSMAHPIFFVRHQMSEVLAEVCLLLAWREQRWQWRWILGRGYWRTEHDGRDCNFRWSENHS